MIGNRLVPRPGGGPAVEVRWPNGKRRVAKYLNGDRTATRIYDEDGQERSCVFTLGGQLSDSPTGSPARRSWRADGSLVESVRYRDGEIRDGEHGEPALVASFVEGSRTEWHYARTGPSRVSDPPNGTPAIRSYYPNGSRRLSTHYRDGRTCNGPGGTPCATSYYESGVVETRSFVDEEGRRHTGPNGEPAFMRFDESGQAVLEAHYEHGVQEHWTTTMMRSERNGAART